jgi:indolepyruvate ferredoxin oxidoreductase
VKEKAAKEAAARHTQLVADLANPPTAPRQIAAE